MHHQVLVTRSQCRDTSLCSTSQ